MKKALPFKRIYKAGNSDYMEIVNFSRSLLKGNPERKKELGLSEKRETRYNKWLVQSSKLVSDLLAAEDMPALFALINITQAKLQEVEQTINGVNEAKEDHQTAIGNSQALKEERDKALVALESAVASFVLVCRYALKGEPQQLEKLGIRVYSPGYKRKSKTPSNTVSSEEPTVEPTPEPEPEPTPEPSPTT